MDRWMAGQEIMQDGGHCQKAESCTQGSAVAQPQRLLSCCHKLLQHACLGCFGGQAAQLNHSTDDKAIHASDNEHN